MVVDFSINKFRNEEKVVAWCNGSTIQGHSLSYLEFFFLISEENDSPTPELWPSLSVYCVDNEISHFIPKTTRHYQGHFRGKEAKTDTEASLYLHFAPL